MSRNFKYFSIGPELGYMMSKIKNRCDHEIDFQGLTIGLGVYLDGLFKRAYVVPFFSVGAVLPDIQQELENEGTCSQTTPIEKGDLDTLDYAMYYRAGLLIGLNWIDKKMAHSALGDYGLQNTFLYFAIKQIPSTSDIDTADVGTEPFIEYGLQFEF